MKYTLIILTAIIGISATVYLVKTPIKPRVVEKPATPLEEYTERLNKAKKNCVEAHGYLFIDTNGQMACMIRKNLGL